MTESRIAALWISAFSFAGAFNIVFALLTSTGRYDWIGDAMSCAVGALCFVAAYRIWQTR